MNVNKNGSSKAELAQAQYTEAKAALPGIEKKVGLATSEGTRTVTEHKESKLTPAEREHLKKLAEGGKRLEFKHEGKTYFLTERTVREMDHSDEDASRIKNKLKELGISGVEEGIANFKQEIAIRDKAKYLLAQDAVESLQDAFRKFAIVWNTDKDIAKSQLKDAIRTALEGVDEHALDIVISEKIKEHEVGISNISVLKDSEEKKATPDKAKLKDYEQQIEQKQTELAHLKEYEKRRHHAMLHTVRTR